MLSIKKINNRRVDVTFEGPLDATMMKAGLDELIEVSEHITHGQMLYRIPAFTVPTFGAIMVELTKLPELFGLLSKFDRCAVLTDAGWLQATARMEGAVMPGLEIAAFDMDDLAAAEAWLAQINDNNEEEEEDIDFAENLPV